MTTIPEKLMSCPFCNATEMVLANERAFALYDKNPVTPGHLLILPSRHVSTYFDATPEEKVALWTMIDRAKAFLDKKHHPDGYNIGINVGEVAGQTVMHLHVHVIPRYQGDIDNPRGGVRGVIPEKRLY